MSTKKNNLKLSPYIKVILLSALLASIFFVSKPQPTISAPGCNDQELSGWAWSDNIGWVSFNCADTPDNCATVDYKVSVDTNGDFYGYAWSDNIGWIDFGPLVDFPADPQSGAKLVGASGKTKGWARACSVFASGCDGALRSDGELGGWDGWISMAPDTGNAYGVTVDKSPDPDEFVGYAWGSDVIGWLSFSCEDEGTCATADYRVFIPDVAVQGGPTFLKVNTKDGYHANPYNVWDPCNDPPTTPPTVCAATPRPKFQWVPSGTQEQYQIQVDDDPLFNSPAWDSGLVASVVSSGIQYPDTAEALTWGEEYFWRVKTVSCSEESAWSGAEAKFTTNRVPTADFSVSQIPEGEDTRYTFYTTSVDPDHEEPIGYTPVALLNGNIAKIEWDFGPNGTIDGTGTQVTRVYSESSPDVTLRIKVTDDGGLTETDTKDVKLRYAPKLVTEKGDIYSLKDIKGHNINFDGAYFIHAGGQIENVTPDNFSAYGDISFPAGTDQYVTSLGKIDWQGLKTCSGSPCLNKYGHEVEDISGAGTIDNPLGGKVYYNSSDYQISNPLVFDNSGPADENGNGIVLIDGDLVIQSDITYSDNPPTPDPKKLASIGFVVKGDLIIDAAVQNLVGAYAVIGADGVGPCTMNEETSAPDPITYSVPDNCGLVKTGSNPTSEVSLDIKGLLFARRFFFQRSTKDLAPGDYAEKISYDYRLFLNPPPGMGDFIKGLPAWQKVAP